MLGARRRRQWLGALADGPARGRGDWERCATALVLAPTTMLSHWRRELARWAPRAKVVVLHRSSTRFDAAARGGARALAEFLAAALAAPPGPGARGFGARPSCAICVASGVETNLETRPTRSNWGLSGSFLDR